MCISRASAPRPPPTHTHTTTTTTTTTAHTEGTPRSARGVQAQAALQAQAGRYAAALAQLERVTAERDKAVAENVGLRKKARLAEISRDLP